MIVKVIKKPDVEYPEIIKRLTVNHIIEYQGYTVNIERNSNNVKDTLHNLIGELLDEHTDKLYSDSNVYDVRTVRKVVHDKSSLKDVNLANFNRESFDFMMNNQVKLYEIVKIRLETLGHYMDLEFNILDPINNIMITSIIQKDKELNTDRPDHIKGNIAGVLSLV